jgi:RNase P subunit RPR2
MVKKVINNKYFREEMHMSDNLFNSLNGLGGFMKGLSSFMPQDDPDTKVFQASSELSELQKNETELYAKIGKKLYPSISNQPEYADLVYELSENLRKQAKAQELLKAAEQEKQQKDKTEADELEARTCPNCQTVNPEGVKFCQECGAKLGQQSQFTCPKCGFKNPPQTRFCGECGARLM